MSVRKSLYAMLAVLALAVPTSGATASSQTAAPKPKLRVYDGSPVRVTGVGFHARERVKLTLSADGVWHKVVRTTKAGSFGAVFPDAKLDRCTGYSVLARGASGARAMAALKVMPLGCAPAGRGPGG
jgi:hypothetical protein